MNHDQIVEHCDAFYQKLCGVPYSGLGPYTIPVTMVNLKTRAQLDEFIFIAEHWQTVTADLSVMDFCRQHKTFYTKMKYSKENLGRRTGHHLLMGIKCFVAQARMMKVSCTLVWRTCMMPCLMYVKLLAVEVGLLLRSLLCEVCEHSARSGKILRDTYLSLLNNLKRKSILV
jgi:hypothetical protein